mgnify:CR=1 FL=1
MADTKYYIDAIERALSLIQQGRSSCAQTILRDALSLKLKTNPSEVLESGSFERTFVPHDDNIDLPKCWFDEENQQLVVDDEGWRIDPKFSDYLFESVKVWQDPILDLNASQIEQRAVDRMKKGMLEGFIRKQ